MTIDTFDQLMRLGSDDDLKRSTLQSLHDLYYGESATSPNALDAFAEQLRRQLIDAYSISAEDSDALLGVLLREIEVEYGGSATRFATEFLSNSGWVSAEDVFSDTSAWFQELWLDEKTGLYYDADGNWYGADRQPISQQPQLWKDDQSGLYYDADGNWYDADRQPVRPTIAGSAQRDSEVEGEAVQRSAVEQSLSAEPGAPIEVSPEVAAILEQPTMQAKAAEFVHEVESAVDRWFDENREVLATASPAEVERLVTEALQFEG